jgi:hypothetical protein
MKDIITRNITEKKQDDEKNRGKVYENGNMDKSKSSRTKTQYVEDNEKRYELERNGIAELDLNIRIRS